MIELLLSFSLATITLALSPGPDNIYVLTTSLSQGIKSGLVTAAGFVAGCIVHTALLAFGISAIITASEGLFYTIKALGAIYLLYLSYKVFKSDATIAFDVMESGRVRLQKSNIQLFRIAVVMNLVNPKVMIFFLAFFPGFLWDVEGNTVQQFFILGLVFMAVSMLVFGGIAILAGSISRYLKTNRNIGTVLKWLQIVVFIGIAVYILIP